ncbi:MAG: dTDP-4-dehydrorhamnose reductase [Leptospiraceae bacterium]|nr:dTDP-4-dehydrorhamnose reductase [Leptospiraceae bacterium]MCP5513335.1 dTDP-4-dehydrorhamnose reductase [Leptospiraceae bacterium]
MIFITGSTGQLGQELSRLLNDSIYTYRTFALSEWDITDLHRSQEILDIQPDILINASAYTAVDRSEEEREIAREVNSAAVGALAEECKKRNIRFIHISTDFVFTLNPIVEDGHLRYWKTNSPTRTLGAYAETKKQGEEFIQSVFGDSPNYHIIRTSWLYSSFGMNFPRTILRLLKDPSRKELKVIEDQIGRPTWAFRLAEFLLNLIASIHKKDGNLKPIYHFSNSGIASWYDFAVAVQEIGLKKGILKEKKLILPIPTEAYPTPAVRPRFSVMDLSESYELMEKIPHWREDLELCLGDPKTILGWNV